MMRHSWSSSLAWVVVAGFIVGIYLPFKFAEATYNEPSLNHRFSIKSSIERFHKNNGFHEVSIRLQERYSSPEESRSVVELENIYHPLEQSNGQFEEVTPKSVGKDQKVYHHDGNTNQWLRLEKGKCSVPKGEPNQELQEELFGDEIANFTRKNTLFKTTKEAGRTKHIIGTARLLLLLEQLWPKFEADETIRVQRGVEVAIHRLKLKPSEEEACPGFHLTAAYRKSKSVMQQQKQAAESIPWYLELGCGDTLLIVSFYDFKLLDNLRNLDKTMSRSIVSDQAFVFPLEVGCGNALVTSNREQKQQQKDANNERDFLEIMISKVSFKAKIKDNLSARAKENNMIFAFDLKAKLLRKDSIKQDSVEDQQILSTTVYDFEQNKKYHSFTRSKRNMMQNMIKPIKSRQRSTTSAGCFVSQIKTTSANANNKRISTDQLSKFINFERLIFMGRVKSINGIGGGGAKIYVDDGPDQLPFWLAPSVVLKRGAHDDDESTISPNVTKLDSYEFEFNSSSGQILLIYYFADEDRIQESGNADEARDESDQVDDEESSSEPKIQLDRLLRLEVFVKDRLRDRLLMSQTVEFSDFSWNQLGTIASGRKTVNTFALSRICASSSSAPQSLAGYSKSSALNKLDFAMILVPESRVLSEQDTKIFEHLINKQITRNEIFIEALEGEFRLSKIYVDQVSSKLLRNNNARQELQGAPRMPSIEFSVRLANLRQDDQAKRHVHWVALGLGQFMDSSQLRRSEVLTLEECLWSAHHYSQLIGEDVLFSYKQNVCGADSNAQECLIDKLYKWRDLQHHEAKIANSSEISSLNYLPYEYGEHFLYKVTYTKSNDYDDIRLRTNPLLNSKPLSQIGKRVSLPILDNETPGVQFILKHLSVSGSIAEFENLVPTTSEAKIKSLKMIDHVAWHRSSDDDKGSIKSASSTTTIATSLNDLLNLDGSKIVEKRDSSPGDDPRPLMTLFLCRSMCLLDIECKSYSYCEASIGGLQSNDRANDCKLSLIDIEFGQTVESIREQIDKPAAASLQEDNQRLARRQTPIRRIKIESGDTKKKIEVSVRINGRCTIYSKSYDDLFAKSSSKEIVPMEFVQHQQVVKNVNDCARRCFERNLYYSRGLIEHKLNLTVVENEIKELKQAQRQEGPISEQKLESLFDWHTRNVRSLCAYFYYSPGKSTDNDHSISATNSSCLLSADLGSLTAGQPRPPSPYQPQGGSPATRMMDLHKLVYANLFERMSGFRLAATISPESEAASSVGAEADGEAAALERYKLLLISHQTGLNRQVQVNLDDIEYCARACILQTHGPRPACSSFDFVYERRAKGHKYCLLNSQSLSDFNQRLNGSNNRTANLQKLLVFAENEDQFWHFEPRDSLLSPLKTPTESNEADQDELDRVWYEFLDKNLVALNRRLFAHSGSAFKKISLLAIIAVFGIASGLLFGAKLAQVWIRRTKNESEEANFMTRLVHRLSGVSISSRLQDGEVWM